MPRVEEAGMGDMDHERYMRRATELTSNCPKGR